MKCGLTGVIGAGKSYVLECFTQLGARTLETDRLAKEILRDDPTLRARVTERWGATVYGEDGEPNRAEIARRIFADPAERAWLEAEVHPRVRAGWQDFLQAQPAAITLVEIPLLFEKGLADHFDWVVAVVAAEATTTPRLLARGWDALEIKRRRSAQWTAAEKARAAHIVLTNDGSLAHIQQQIQVLWDFLAA